MGACDEYFCLRNVWDRQLNTTQRTRDDRVANDETLLKRTSTDLYLTTNLYLIANSETNNHHV